jgi:hypothetical protein
MSSRDIWSKGGGEKIQDLLGSLLTTLIMEDAVASPLYLCSPYLSDFILLDNAFGQVSTLFTQIPELADKGEILFSETLREVSFRMPVRIVTVRHPSSIAFVERIMAPSHRDISTRIAPDIYHEKGLLCDGFYVEGSMNFTYSGIYIRDEKVTCHIAEDPGGRQKIDAAFLEFDRLWNNLGNVGPGRTAE